MHPGARSLHASTRERDPEGRIVATLEDYAAVRPLVLPRIGEAVERSVNPLVRQTVDAVQALIEAGAEEASGEAVAQQLGLDKGSASRRIKAARQLGYLVNNEEKRGRPMRLALGSPMPEDAEILPSPERLRGCTFSEEMHAPPVRSERRPEYGEVVL